jgi:N6-adenosine-specific RNA methylase IME4
MKIDNEFKNLISPLTSEEFVILEKNIIERGIQDSIKVWQGIIIDGHNRYEIACKHNIHYDTTDLCFESRQSVIEWILNNQLGRRNLNKYNRSLIALKLEDIYNAKGKENIVKSNKQKSSLEISPNQKIDTRKVIAEKANVSDNTIAKVKHIEKKAAPEVKEKLKKDEITINKAFNDIKKADTKAKRQETIKKVKPITGKYKIIYADPPWQYNDKQDTKKLGGAEKHYNTMSIDELCNMPIKDKTENDSVLFLWVTSPLLEDGFKIINAWGFSYKSSFVWDKVKHNMGHYNSVRHEFLLIATKGKCTPENVKLFDSVQSIEKTKKHSEKPEEFRSIIDTLYPSGNRIELFSRKKYNDSWEVWGNEV